MLKIETGKLQRAIKTVIYGAEGIGKSTLASKFPEPLFIDIEDGTARLDVRRIRCNKSWDELISNMKEIIANPEVCKTLVIDTADAAESLASKSVCDKYHQPSIEAFGYGKGYTYLQETFQELLTLADKLIELGINVTFIAHGKPRKFELPEEAGSFDRWEMKLTRQVAPLLKEWTDILLFANYKTYVVSTENNSKKAQGGKRVMYTSHHPTFDAKNRFELPDELDLDFKSIEHLFNPTTKAAQTPKKAAVSDTFSKVGKLIEEAKVTEEEVRRVVADKGHYPFETPISEYAEEFLIRWLIPNFTKIVETINKTKGDK